MVLWGVVRHRQIFPNLRTAALRSGFAKRIIIFGRRMNRCAPKAPPSFEGTAHQKPSWTGLDRQ